MLKETVQLLCILCICCYAHRNHLLPLGAAWIFESDFFSVINFLNMDFLLCICEYLYGTPSSWYTVKGKRRELEEILS